MKLTKEDIQVCLWKDEFPQLTIGNFSYDELKQLRTEILQNQKLRELVDERIEILSRPDAPDSRVIKVVLNVCNKLLEDSKK